MIEDELVGVRSPQKKIEWRWTPN